MGKKGRHPRFALSAKAVKAFSSSGGTKRIADGGGLYLVASPGGSKSWVLRTIIKGKRSDIGLGGADLVSLAEAREQAHKLRKIARAGRDPLAERRREQRVVPTFEDAAKAFHATYSAGFKNAKHTAQWISSLTDYAFPFVGPKLVNQIEQADILHCLIPIWITKPETARRVKQRIKLLLDWCKVKGYRNGDNPVADIRRVLPKHRTAQAHHAALAYAAVPAFITELRKADAHEVVKLGFELLILTVARTNEVLGATWPEIDLDAKVWIVPAARMKAGIEHRVPLSARAVEIIERAKVLSDGSPYVFPGAKAERPLSNMAFLMCLRRMKCDDATVHGFRSSFKDWCSERTHAAQEVSEAALAHTVKDRVEAAYARSDLFEKRRPLMDQWSTFVTAKPADVVAFHA
jgi:integrase